MRYNSALIRAAVRRNIKYIKQIQKEMRTHVSLAIIFTICLQSCTGSYESGEEMILSGLWYIDSLNGQKILLPENRNISLEFDKPKGKIYGFAGCNRYFGKYSTDRNKIKFSELAATNAYCENQDIENIFVKLLPQAEEFRLSSGVLRIYSSGKVIMVFNKAYR